MKLKIKNALVSVSDKENIISLLKVFQKYKINIISSGGTYKSIKNLGMSVPNYLNLLVLKKC